MIYDEPIIRLALLDEYRKCFGSPDNEKEKEQLIKRLKELEAKS
jgi:hypothetical protein